ncbi:MAG TPA: hypothetical protein VH599_22410 [Ktedonobacterales bacterium]
MLEQGVSVQRVKIWSLGFTALFVLLVFLAVLFISHLSEGTLRFFFYPVQADRNQLNYHICSEFGAQSTECLDVQGESIFIYPDAFLLLLYALGLVVLICLAGLFITGSKLMRLGVFPLQLLSVIGAGILVVSGTPLIIHQVVYEAERIIRPLSFIMLGLNHFSMLLLSYRIRPWKKRWWSLFGVIPVLVGIVTPVLLLLFRPSGWKWRPEALPLLILGEAAFFLTFGFSVESELSTGFFISTYLPLGLAFLLIVRTEQMIKNELG